MSDLQIESLILIINLCESYSSVYQDAPVLKIHLQQLFFFFDPFFIFFLY